MVIHSPGSAPDPSPVEVRCLAPKEFETKSPQQVTQVAHSVDPSVKVSVLVITYNQERYIRQALEGALAQKTDFAYEIVVGEDCSTDRTRKICEEFADQYPGRICLLPSEPNLGMHRNFRRTYASCQGKYIAMLEGDDFWTSPDKLQLQATLLDAHPDIAVSFHEVNRLDEQGRRRSGIWPNFSVPERTGLAEILQADYVPSCSMMVRRSAVPEIPEWFEELAMGDWPLLVLASLKGDLHFTLQPLATYRLHANGVWSSMDSLRVKRERLRLYLVLESHLPSACGTLIRSRRDEYIDAILNEASAYASSHSYRLGRALLFPYRIARQLLQWTNRRAEPQRDDLRLARSNGRSV